eukprot:CAMPEP_0184292712 /NCGR_PEP_ID=MMETSP1049-20130417/4420_1 /TAXON_ID=77928 /ORGANISM="Proteomonas sulcata, Strain CCMP704" /LENGTH=306 /DNA_ID=CAMNT_0026600585 /DNA_START=784 /DNA_END=1705 /DNA_ORIENTATION=-
MSSAVRRMLALSRENSEEPDTDAKESHRVWKETQHQDDPRPCGPVAVSSGQTPVKASPTAVPEGGPLSPSIAPEVARALAAIQEKDQSPDSLRFDAQRVQALPHGNSISGRSTMEDVIAIESVLQKSLSRLDELEGSKVRYEKWKNDAIKHGLRMVEEERTRGQVEREILLRRISFLTEELEETKSSLDAKKRDYEELMEAAQEISATASHADMCERDLDANSEFSYGPSMMASPEPAPKHWINHSPMKSPVTGSSKGRGSAVLASPSAHPAPGFDRSELAKSRQNEVSGLFRRADLPLSGSWLLV